MSQAETLALTLPSPSFNRPPPPAHRLEDKFAETSSSAPFPGVPEEPPSAVRRRVRQYGVQPAPTSKEGAGEGGGGGGDGDELTVNQPHARTRTRTRARIRDRARAATSGNGRDHDDPPADTAPPPSKPHRDATFFGAVVRAATGAGSGLDRGVNVLMSANFQRRHRR